VEFLYRRLSHYMRDGGRLEDRTRTFTVSVLDWGLTVFDFSLRLTQVNEVRAINAQPL
jgi:hypothetical protein